jgi:3-oxoacyl-[acyl-carrier-protein] synthase-3
MTAAYAGSPPVSLIDVASYLPGDPVPVDYYLQYADPDDLLEDSAMFRAPKYRHHVGPDETGVDMIGKAVANLAERIGERAVHEVDLLITNVLLPDMPFTGAGAAVADRIGAEPGWIIDHHNAGCAAFIAMMKLARTILAGGEAKSALLCAVQNCGGQVFTQTDIRRKTHAAVPGDGCGVGYLTVSDESPILDIEMVNHGEYAKDCGIRFDDDRKYWAAGEGQMDVRFTESSVAKIIARGNRLVPEVVGALCDRLGMSTSDIDRLVTNQPNRMFLRNWQEALRLEPERHLDTFDDCGNLFGAGVPITLDRALREDRVPDGSLLVLAGFAHAGDFAAATALRWKAGR